MWDQALGPQYAHLFDSGRMSWRTRDFFDAWPALDLPDPVGGCVDAPGPEPAVFLLSMVLHNWNDADCKRGVYLPRPLPCPRAAPPLIAQLILVFYAEY